MLKKVRRAYGKQKVNVQQHETFTKLSMELLDEKKKAQENHLWKILSDGTKVREYFFSMSE